MKWRHQEIMRIRIEVGIIIRSIRRERQLVTFQEQGQSRREEVCFVVANGPSEGSSMFGTTVGSSKKGRIVRGVLVKLMKE